MRAIWETDLPELLAPEGDLSPAGAAAVIRRWERAGLAEARRVFVAEPRIVYMTRAGARALGAEGWRELAEFTARHAADVSRVRLWITREQASPGRALVVEWVTERRWRRDNVEALRAGAHVPDGVAVLASGQRAAIEVERTDKGVPRTVDVITQLLQGRYDRVFYVVRDERVARTVRSAVLRSVEGLRARGMTQLAHVEVLALPDEVRA